MNFLSLRLLVFAFSVLDCLNTKAATSAILQMMNFGQLLASLYIDPKFTRRLRILNHCY